MSGHDESLDEATLILDEVFSHGTVDLSDRFLGDSCVPIIDVLRQRDTAHSIILKGNMATSEACIHALSKLILSARTLRSLSLEWNSIGFPIALAEAVAQAPGLTSLDLRNCELSSSSVASVLLAAQPGSRLSLLDLRWNVLGSSAGVQFLQAAQTGKLSLRELKLDGTGITPSVSVQIQTVLSQNPVPIPPSPTTKHTTSSMMQEVEAKGEDEKDNDAYESYSNVDEGQLGEDDGFRPSLQGPEGLQESDDLHTSPSGIEEVLYDILGAQGAEAGYDGDNQGSMVSVEVDHVSKDRRGSSSSSVSISNSSKSSTHMDHRDSRSNSGSLLSNTAQSKKELNGGEGRRNSLKRTGSTGAKNVPPSSTTVSSPSLLTRRGSGPRGEVVSSGVAGPRPTHLTHKSPRSQKIAVTQAIHQQQQIHQEETGRRQHKQTLDQQGRHQQAKPLQQHQHQPQTSRPLQEQRRASYSEVIVPDAYPHDHYPSKQQYAPPHQDTTEASYYAEEQQDDGGDDGESSHHINSEADPHASVSDNRSEITTITIRDDTNPRMPGWNNNDGRVSLDGHEQDQRNNETSGDIRERAATSRRRRSSIDVQRQMQDMILVLQAKDNDLRAAQAEVHRLQQASHVTQSVVEQLTRDLQKEKQSSAEYLDKITKLQSALGTDTEADRERSREMSEMKAELEQLQRAHLHNIAAMQNHARDLRERIARAERATAAANAALAESERREQANAKLLAVQHQRMMNLHSIATAAATLAHGLALARLQLRRTLERQQKMASHAKAEELMAAAGEVERQALMCASTLKQCGFDPDVVDSRDVVDENGNAMATSADGGDSEEKGIVRAARLQIKQLRQRVEALREEAAQIKAQAESGDSNIRSVNGEGRDEDVHQNGDKALEQAEALLRNINVLGEEIGGGPDNLLASVTEGSSTQSKEADQISPLPNLTVPCTSSTNAGNMTSGSSFPSFSATTPRDKPRTLSTSRMRSSQSSSSSLSLSSPHSVSTPSTAATPTQSRGRSHARTLSQTATGSLPYPSSQQMASREGATIHDIQTQQQPQHLARPPSATLSRASPHQTPLASPRRARTPSAYKNRTVPANILRSALTDPSTSSTPSVSVAGHNTTYTGIATQDGSLSQTPSGSFSQPTSLSRRGSTDQSTGRSSTVGGGGGSGSGGGSSSSTKRRPFR